MYYATYGTEYLHDPFSEDQVVAELSITGKVNAQGSCEFTIAPSHPLYDKLKIRDLSEPVKVYEDSTVIFDGYIYSIDDQFDASRNISCNGCLSYLGDSIVRPYATVQKDDDQPNMLYSGASIAGLFSWYIDQHNQHTDNAKHFVIGKNEGSQLDDNENAYRSNTNYPTTSNEIESQLLDSVGGYIFTRYENDTRYIDYFAECVDVNAQIIDFGVNITDYTKSDSSESMYTVLIPQGATPESKDNSNTKQYPIDIKSIPDGPTSVSGIYKSGDHLYDKDGVDKYGMIEKFETFSDIYEPENLLKAAALSLKTQSTPVTKIEVKAVDLSLYMDNYKPLIPGQLVRIRSLPHNIDTYMLLSEMSIDVEDPSNTTYTFGITYDTLTGQQSKRIQELNSSINSSLDAVASIDQATKDNAVAVGAATKIANDAKNTANTANDTANTAKDTADTAKNTADTAKDTAIAASNTAAEAKTTADSANNAAAELQKKTAEIDKQVEAASAKADQVRTDLTQQVQNVKSEMDSAVEAAQTSANEAQSAADAAQKAADKANASTVDLDKSIKAVDAKAIAAKQAAAEAQSKAENVESDLDSANAVIEQHTTELGELTTKVTNAVNESESALSVSTEAKQTATEASTTATSAYADAQTALTQSTTATQTATTAKTTAESASKTASDSLKQSSAAVQTANQISTTLRTEYQTKADADKLYATQSSLKQTSDSITASVSKTYATKDALSALQNVADNAIESWRGTGVPTLTNKPASDWTTNADKKKHSGDLYYDKSTGKAYRFGSDDGETYTWELNQDTDVTKALENAAKAQTSANNAQASATAANTAAGNAQSTANTAVSNAATAKNAADAAQSSANKAQGDVDKLKIDIPETYATKSSLTQTAESITANVESVKATANSAVTAASNAQQTADGISANLTKNYQTKAQADTIYATKASLKANSDSISAEVAKAQGTADGAVTAASKAQQTADAVTLNLSNNYQTKAQNDALYATQTSLKATSDSLSANITANANTAQSAVDKATSLEANLNGFKTTVAETYTTKNDVGVGNLIKNGDFSDGMTNWTTTGGTSKIVDGTYGKQFVFTQTGTNTNGSNRIYNDTHNHINGQSYEVSFYAKADKSSKWHFGPTGSSKAASTTLDTTLKQYTMQYQADNTTVFSVWTDNPTATIHLERVKLSVASGYYATKTEVTQTANSIKAEVTEVSNTANSALTKATTVEQTANGLNSKITEQGKTLNATVTTANEAKSTADSNKTAISQTANLIDAALTGDNLIIDGGFESTEYWRGLKAPFRLSVESLYHGSHVLVADAVTSGDIRCPLTHPKGNASESTTITVTSGRTYRLGGYVRWLDAVPNNLNRSTDKLRLAKDDGTFIKEAVCSTSNKWSYTYADWHCPDDGSITSIKIEVMHQNNATILWDDVSFCDITEAFNTNSKVVSVEQNLNGFKTTVAETYTTKNDFNNLTIGGTNRIVLTGVKPGRIDREGNVGFGAAQNDHCYTIPVSAEPNTKYTISGSIMTPNAGYVSVAFYDENGKFISRPIGAYTATEAPWKNTFTSPANAVTMRSSFPVIFKGKIKLEKGDKPTDWSPAPEDLQPAGDYSTKSYVDQTAKSVALGVVQNYKGADGSGLATKSDITVAKDSITSTVANTYATKSGVTQEISSKITQNNNSLDVKFATKTETQEAQNTANTANSNATNAQSRVGNIEDCITLTSNGVRAGKQSNGVFTGVSALVNTDGSFDLLDSNGELLTRINQHTFRVTGDNGVGAGRITLSQDGINITVQPTADASKTYHIQVGKSGVGITAPDGSSIECSASCGLNIETVEYGKIAIGSGGLQFTNDQGWGLTLSSAGWSIKWAGNHTLATGPKAGALYIDGHEIVTR